MAALKNILLFALMACTLLTACRPKGDEAAAQADLSSRSQSASYYQSEVQPVFDSRCAVCHSCYDAPCMLNLTSWEGLQRGAKNASAYDGRAIRTKPMRLGIDAKSRDEWKREFKFHSVLGKSAGKVEDSSPLRRLLRLKEKYPKELDAGISFDQDFQRMCPSQENIGLYEEAKKWGGMPYGFPALSDAEHSKVKNWLNNGGRGSDRVVPVSPSDEGSVIAWQEFFNDVSSRKKRLTARYLYEHLFLAHIYFEDGTKAFYRLVRSRTAHPRKIDEIATRHPFDPPKGEFYYRFKLLKESFLVKTHILYKLDNKKKQLFKELFHQSQWIDIGRSENEDLYGKDIRHNVFDVFAEIPPKSRYRFLLDEAEYFVRTFIRGPVCKGKAALNVINDQFWVTFLDPESDPSVKGKRFLYRNKENIDFPSIVAPLKEVAGYFFDRGFSARINEFNNSLAGASRGLLGKKGLTVDNLWDGDGVNPNALLTVHRHYDSASVTKGLKGNIPKTAWVLDYHTLESIYYNLVASFDVYGSVNHKLTTRLFMEASRFSGEDRFLALLPAKNRHGVREFWNRDGIGSSIIGLNHGWGTLKRSMFQFHDIGAGTARRGGSIDHKKNRDLVFDTFSKFLSRLQPKVKGGKNGFDLVNCYSCATRGSNELKKLKPEEVVARNHVKFGPNLGHLPDLAYVRVTKRGRPVGWYTLIKNVGHYNVARILGDESKRIEQHRVSYELHRGFIGSHVNIFFTVEQSKMRDFLISLEGKSDSNVDPWKEPHRAFRNSTATRYAIGRFHSDFWTISDQSYEWLRSRKAGGVGFRAARLDLGRYWHVF